MLTGEETSLEKQCKSPVLTENDDRLIGTGSKTIGRQRRERERRRRRDSEARRHTEGLREDSPPTGSCPRLWLQSLPERTSLLVKKGFVTVGGRRPCLQRKDRGGWPSYEVRWRSCHGKGETERGEDRQDPQDGKNLPCGVHHRSHCEGSIDRCVMLAISHYLSKIAIFDLW